MNSSTPSICDKISSYTCEICGLKLIQEHSLKIHMHKHALNSRKDMKATVHHEEMSKPDQITVSETIVKENDKQAKPKKISGNVIYNCKECDYKTSRYTYLWQHMRRHGSEKP